jgi:hypothetical protein
MKMSNKNKAQSQPSPVVTAEVANAPENVIAAVQDMSEEEAAKVTTIPKRFKRFGRRDVTVSKVAAGKVQLLQDAKAAFAEAATLSGKGNEQETKAVEISNRGGLMLARGRIAGLLAPSEVSTVLGDSFGWNGKGSKVGTRVTSAEPDATRSATPYGLGNQVRQRIVRAVNAYLFTHGQQADAGAFFEGLDPSDVAPLLTETLNNDGSLWTLYQQLSNVKASVTGIRPKDAFNPKKIASITASLGENLPFTIEQFIANPALFEAYDSLYRMLGEIDRSLPDDESEAA